MLVLSLMVLLLCLIEHVAEESTTTIEQVEEEKVPAQPVEAARLEFLKPVTPELRTVSDQELRLE